MSTKEIIQMHKRAALQGNIEASYFLGQIYRDDVKDFHEAAKWFSRAAEFEHAPAQVSLGELYEKGLGVSRSYYDALWWYRQAAALNSAHAAYRAAHLYAEGRGVRRNRDKALNWLREAAALRHVEAQYMLASWLEDGLGVETNALEAAKWYRMVAETGHARAQFRLGLMYAEGRYANRKGWSKARAVSPIQALAWFTLAAAQKYKPAMTADQELQATMLSHQIKKAHQLADKLYKRIEASKSK